MKKDNLLTNGLFTGAVILVLSALLFVVGCETETTDTGLKVEVTPEENVNGGFLLTVTGLTNDESTNSVVYMPLTWTVSNPSIGNIRVQGGYSATYESTGAFGQNTVTVRDQAGREGLALLVTESPTPTPST